jgi:hypothetical protein
MFSLFLPRKIELIVDHDKVACPNRGRDVPIELCAGCELLSEFDEKANPPVIRCRSDLSGSAWQ